MARTFTGSGALLLSLVMLATACGDNATTTSAPPTAPPVPQSTTATTQPVATTLVTTTTPATTQPPATEAEPPENAAPAFAITGVTFGDGGFVQITNTGNGAGNLDGHWLCQRPAYLEMPSTELGPGESVWVAASGSDLQFVGAVVGVVDAEGRLGSFSLATGEMALYASRDFGSAAAIVDYVEWGASGHGRSSVAVEAAIWPQGGFVEIPDGTISITAGSAGADDPAAWSPDIGV